MMIDQCVPGERMLYVLLVRIGFASIVGHTNRQASSWTAVHGCNRPQGALAVGLEDSSGGHFVTACWLILSLDMQGLQHHQCSQAERKGLCTAHSHTAKRDH
jgi:hypothetical protein